MVRRLAAEARWEELDAIVQVAAVAVLVDVAVVLCEVLESDARPPNPGHLVDALGHLRYDDAAELLERLLETERDAEPPAERGRRGLPTGSGVDTLLRHVIRGRASS